jgi:hypothetical protein
LARFNRNAENIFIEECRSLVCEAKGDLGNAIKHRENEIRLIRRLHEISQGTESEAYVFSQYDYADLSERLDILAMLYHAIGSLDKSISTLEESRQLCQIHGIDFDGQDILQEYLGFRIFSTAQAARFTQFFSNCMIFWKSSPSADLSVIVFSSVLWRNTLSI